MEGQDKIRLQATKERAQADILGSLRISKAVMVIFDEFFVEGIFLHAHETVYAFKDGLTEAIIVGNVGELFVIQLRHLLARFGRVVRLSQKWYQS